MLGHWMLRRGSNEHEAVESQLHRLKAMARRSFLPNLYSVALKVPAGISDSRPEELVRGQKWPKSTSFPHASHVEKHPNA